MSREARMVLPEVPHHITQRGIRKSDTFRDVWDYRHYTELMCKYCKKYGVLVRSYTWMSNHSHTVAIPLKPDSFARAFRCANSVYARSFNKRYGFSGYLWEDRFFSCPLDEDHFWAAMRYVERNPVRAGLVPIAEQHQWSSAAFHCSGASDPLIDTTWDPRDVIDDWRSWLKIPNEDAIDKRIREDTRSGRPCGSKSFVSKMELELGRILQRQRRGPKPRLQKEENLELELL